MNDDQLKAFLQKHQPLAPEGDVETTLQRTLGRLGLTTTRRPWAWMSFGGLVAAGVAAVLFVTKPLVPDTTLATPAAIEALLESDFFYEDEELPTLDAGEDFETLAANLTVEGGAR